MEIKQILENCQNLFASAQADGELEHYGEMEQNGPFPNRQTPEEAAKAEDFDIVLRLEEGGILAFDGGAYHLICDIGGPCGVRYDVEEEDAKDKS